MKEWMKVIPESDHGTYKRAGLSGDLQLGERPALLVIDATYGFTGSPNLTLEEAIQEFSSACGPASWEAMPRISRLIELFRARQLPVVYSYSDSFPTVYTGRATKAKGRPVAPKFNEFPEMIAPAEGEWTLGKTKASIFFQTPLTAYLTRQKVDTLVVCGVSTSGCVRASVVDGFSHGYPTFVIDDCCFDRSYFAHCANLFDMHAKYASVLSLHELDSLMTKP